MDERLSLLQTFCAFVLVASMHAPAFGQGRGPAPRVPAPVARPAAPVPHPVAPAQLPHPAGPVPGFNLNRDVNARPVPIQPRVLPQPIRRAPVLPAQQRVPVPQQRVTLPPPVRRAPVAPLTTPGNGPFERRFQWTVTAQSA